MPVGLQEQGRGVERAEELRLRARFERVLRGLGQVLNGVLVQPQLDEGAAELAMALRHARGFALGAVEPEGLLEVAPGLLVAAGARGQAAAAEEYVRAAYAVAQLLPQFQAAAEALPGASEVVPGFGQRTEVVEQSRLAFAEAHAGCRGGRLGPEVLRLGVVAQVEAAGAQVRERARDALEVAHVGVSLQAQAVMLLGTPHVALQVGEDVGKAVMRGAFEVEVS